MRCGMLVLACAGLVVSANSPVWGQGCGSLVANPCYGTTYNSPYYNAPAAYAAPAAAIAPALPPSYQTQPIPSYGGLTTVAPPVYANPYTSPGYAAPLYQPAYYGQQATPYTSSYPVMNRRLAGKWPTITARPSYAPRSAGYGAYPSYVGAGLLGQPKAYVPGQPLRNFFRYLTP